MRSFVFVVALGFVMYAAETFGACAAGDVNRDGEVTIDEIVRTVDAALHGCTDEGSPDGPLLATGQTTSYGPGSDGDVQAGLPLRYRDNGDGTISDLNTGLMWEKKSADGSIHDVNNRYRWGIGGSPWPMNGTMVTEFLATLNAGSGFAGYKDWRIPNVRELKSLVNYGLQEPGMTVAAVFDTGCTPGCSVMACSCTAAGGYWSSTTTWISPYSARDVNFNWGHDVDHLKDNNENVRAVRGGL